MPETVLLTGATGFIGLALARRLSAAGLRVRCLVRPGTGASGLDLPGIELFGGDLLDQAALEGAVRGVGRVWHLAALVRPTGFLAGRAALLRRFEEVNAAASGRLAEAAARAGVKRFIYFSSVSALGPGEDLADGAVPRPLTYYGRSKLAGEQRLAEVSARTGLDCLVLRPAMIYGPGAPGWEPLFAAARRGRVTVPGDGSNRFSVCYLENLLDAAMTAAEKAGPGAVLNVAEGSFPLRDLVSMLGAALGREVALTGLPVGMVKAVSAALHGALGLAGLYMPGFIGADPARVAEACASWSHKCEGLRGLGWTPDVGTAEGLAASIGAGR